MTPPLPSSPAFSCVRHLKCIEGRVFLWTSVNILWDLTLNAGAIFLAAVIDRKLAKKSEICSLRGRHKKGGGGGREKRALTLTSLANSPPFFPYPFRRMLCRLEICDTPLNATIYHDLQNFYTFTIFTKTIMHPKLTPRILHNHCKMLGVNKEH